MRKIASTGRIARAALGAPSARSGAASTFGDALRRPAGVSSSSRFSMRLVSLPPGTHRLSLVSVPVGDGLGIGLAQVAALAAVLLRHGGEQAARQRLAVGELHALGDRHGGIVPGRAVVLGRPAPWRQRPACAPSSGVGAGLGVERQQAGEEAVEPGALLVGERRAVGDHDCLGGGAEGRCWTVMPRRPPRATPSTIALSALDLMAAGEGEEGLVAAGGASR